MSPWPSTRTLRRIRSTSRAPRRAARTPDRARPAEGALDGDIDRGAEERDLDLHRERRAPVGLVACAVVGEAQRELERDLDEAEHAQVAAHPQVAGERGREVGAGLLALELEVDAGHDVDAAAGDAQIHRRGGAELERRLDDLEAGGIELQVEESAAAEDPHREQERDADAPRR